MKYLILATLILASCAPVQTVPEKTETPMQEEPSKAFPCARGSWCQVWTDTVKQKITPNLLNANYGSFCSNYRSLDKQALVLNFVKSVAYAESGWNPEETYTETTMGKDAVTGKQIVSEGLMQMSYVDSKNWSSVPDCKAIDYAKKNIRDPQINLGCAMGIMGKLAGRNLATDVSDKASLGAYWSTVRIGKTKSRAKLKSLMGDCK